MVGPERQRLVHMGDGGIHMAEIVLEQAFVEIAEKEIRGDCQGPIERRRSALEILHHAEDVAQRRIGRGIVRIEHQGPLGRRLRRRNLAHSPQGFRKLYLNRRRVRIQLGSLEILRMSTAWIARARKKTAQLDKHRRIFRSQFL